MRQRIIPAAVLLAAAALLGAARGFTEDVPLAGDVPAGFWNARLWLTSQAFGLPEDCPVGVLFKDPPFRSVAIPGGGAATSRLSGRTERGSDVFFVIDAIRGTAVVERVTLRLRWHREQGIVSVQSIGVETPDGTEKQMLSYETAVDDDEEYDLYTDTLVSLYRSFFDARTIRQRTGASAEQARRR